MKNTMRDIGEGTIRRIDWTELTPAVLLLRIFNLSLGFRVLFLALVGWWLTVMWTDVASAPDWARELWNMTNVERKTGLGETFRLAIPLDAIYAGYLKFFPSSFASLGDFIGWLIYLCGVLLIGTFFGGTICRIVAVRLTVDESEPIKNLFLFFRKRGIGFISSMIILSLGILCCWIPVFLAGCAMEITFLNYVVGVLFPIPILFAFFTAILLLGFVAGWMLLFAAVSTDGSDGFDAISRLFSYLFQRPLHYLLYWFLSGILGWLGFVLVQIVTHAAISLCWNVLPDLNWLPSRQSWEPPMNSLNSFSSTFSQSMQFDSVRWSEFWFAMTSSLPTAYLFAWFWTSSVAIYLLLRRSVDATPFNEVYRVVPPNVRTLPTIKPDEQGAPEIVE